MLEILKSCIEVQTLHLQYSQKQFWRSLVSFMKNLHMRKSILYYKCNRLTVFTANQPFPHLRLVSDTPRLVLSFKVACYGVMHRFAWFACIWMWKLHLPSFNFFQKSIFKLCHFLSCKNPIDFTVYGFLASFQIHKIYQIPESMSLI